MNLLLNVPAEQPKAYNDRYLVSRTEQLLSAGWFRVFLLIIVSISFKLLLDVIFSLVYRNYQAFHDVSDYLLNLSIAMLVAHGVQRINRKLDNRIPWEAGLLRRFSVQSLLNVLYGLVVMLVIKVAIVNQLIGATFIRFQDELVVNLTLIGFIMTYEVIDLSMFLQRRWRLSLAKMERFEKENIAFQFEMLKTQINPHFLFNSLNTLSSLVNQDRDRATTFIRKLSSVYRHILENRDKEMIRLEDELLILQDYAYMLQLRFQDKLFINIDLPDRLRQWMVPPMTLQMLIENAIKHNVISDRKKLTVTIDAEETDAHPCLVVRNNLQLKTSGEFSSELGLKNISSRYRFLTDQPVVIDAEGGFFTVKIPLLQTDA